MHNHRSRLIAFFVAMTVVIAAPMAVIASDVFTDVPDSNVFHDDISWLKNAGVTIGCNPPANTEFCPSDNVTREQMAAFMHRLAENEVVNAATAVDAESAQAINGVTISRFFAQVAPNTVDAAIDTFGPVTLSGSCDAAGEPMLRASWDEEVNHMTFNGATSSLFGNGSVDPGQTIDIGGGQFGSVGLAEAVGFASHAHTSIEFFLRNSAALGENLCFFSGFVTVG